MFYIFRFALSIKGYVLACSYSIDIQILWLAKYFGWLEENVFFDEAVFSFDEFCFAKFVPILHLCYSFVHVFIVFVS